MLLLPRSPSMWLWLQAAEVANVAQQTEVQQALKAANSSEIAAFQSANQDLRQQVEATTRALSDSQAEAAAAQVRAVAAAVAIAESTARGQSDALRRELQKAAAQDALQAAESLQQALDDAAANRKQLLQVRC